MCVSVPCWPRTLKSNEFPGALGNSQGDVGQAGVGGPATPQRASGPALHVHNGRDAGAWLSLCVQGLEGGGFPLYELRLAFLTVAHSVCAGDRGTSRRQMHLCVDQKLFFSLVPQLFHSHSLLLEPHVTARCGCGGHTYKQEGHLLCSLGRGEELSLFPGLMSALRERDRVWLCLEKTDQTLDLHSF